MFARTWRDAIDAEMARDHRVVSRRHGLLRMMSANTVMGRPLVAAVSQRWCSSRYDWYDATAFDEVVTSAELGWLVVAYGHVGATPGRDREQQANDAKLQGLPAPFEAWFAGGQGDCDGWLSWQGYLSVDHPLVDESILRMRFPTSGVPLEVGSTDPDTTIWHLRHEGGLARWPYGFDYLTLLLRTTGPPAGRAWPLAKPTVEQGCLMLDPDALDLEHAGSGDGVFPNTRRHETQQRLALDG